MNFSINFFFTGKLSREHNTSHFKLRRRFTRIPKHGPNRKTERNHD